MNADMVEQFRSLTVLELKCLVRGGKDELHEGNAENERDEK